jgi:hypothetical protein
MSMDRATYQVDGRPYVDRIKALGLTVPQSILLSADDVIG